MNESVGDSTTLMRHHISVSTFPSAHSTSVPGSLNWFRNRSEPFRNMFPFPFRSLISRRRRPRPLAFPVPFPFRSLFPEKARAQKPACKFAESSALRAPHTPTISGKEPSLSVSKSGTPSALILSHTSKRELQRRTGRCHRARHRQPPPPPCRHQRWARARRHLHPHSSSSSSSSDSSSGTSAAGCHRGAKR